MKKSKLSVWAMTVVVVWFAAALALPILRGEAPIDLGLDLSGGVIVTYRPDFSTRLDNYGDLGEAELLELARDTLASRLERKLNTVPDVVIRGDRTIAVSLPSRDDVGTTLARFGETYHLTMRLVIAGHDEPVEGVELFGYRGRHLELAPAAFSGDMLDAVSIKVETGRSDTLDLAASAPKVAFRFEPPHDEAFAAFTRDHVGEDLAILLDDEVEWAGVIESAIIGGGVLAGGYTLEEATDVAMMLRSGVLPVALEVDSLSAVGPSLGQAVQDLGRSALVLAVALLALLLTLAYLHRSWFLVAGLASLFCLLFFIAGLAAVFDLTLDMVGIAGIILSVGMGMDAFIIVFESLESKLGRYSPKQLAAHSERISRSMYSFASEGRTLFHANATTLVVIMLLLSTERLESFARFIFVGIFASVLTIFMTREILQRTYGLLPDSGLDLLGWLRRGRPGVFRLRKLYFAAVAAVILLAGVLITIHAPGSPSLELGADFRAGTQLSVTAESESEVRASLVELGQHLADVEIRHQRLGPAEQGRYLVTLGTTLVERVADTVADSSDLSADGLARFFAARPVELESVESITGKISSQRLARGLSVLVLSFVLLALYFVFLQGPVDRLVSSRRRRRTLPATRARVFAGILLAVIVDVVFVLAAVAFLSIPVNLPVIAGVLTIIGYSVNDSVVLWTHVRNRQADLGALGERSSPIELVSAGVDSILSRACLTSLSTLIPALTILAVGLTPLVDFAWVMIVGTVAGTLSSMFVVGSAALGALERERRSGAAPGLAGAASGSVI